VLFDDPNESNTMTENPTTENPTTENPTTEKPSSNKEGTTKKEIEKKNSLVLFEDFWKPYPKKQSRATAEKSFIKLSAEEQQKAIDALSEHSRFWSLKY
jgi:hypothetical protein